MKRKKFVKQLMAMGYQRNSANGLALYARMGGWTYEQYLEVERRSYQLQNSMITAASKIADALKPALVNVGEAVKQAAARMNAILASVDMGLPYASELLRWLTENVEEDPLPPWPKENPHRSDAMDALPYNMQIMSAADHDTLHGGGQK